MSAGVAGMTDTAEMAEPLASGSYDGRKAAIRAATERGVEIRVRSVRRRSWPDEAKLRMVRETLEPGAVVQAVAERNGVGTGQLYTWRKEMLTTAVSGFVPVAVAPEVPRVEAPSAQRDMAVEAPGTIEIALPSGTTVRVSGRVDVAVLRGILAELSGR
jgi:transposase